MTIRDTDDTRLLLHAYVDGELDTAAARDIERRLAADSALAGEHARLVALRRAIRDRLPRETAPQRLRDAVLSIGVPDASASVVEFRPSHRPASAPASRRTWLARAATLLVGLGLGSSVTYVATERYANNSAVETAALDAAVAGHIRALAAETPFDVASSDRHTVKPWFAGKVTFAPQVVDLAEEGFPLAGGRVDVVAGRTAATLVYRHDKHFVSLTAVPDPNEMFKAPVRSTPNGFSVVHWWASGIAYWAVSDVAPDALDSFVAAFRTKTQAP
jgi:anti-sigma factor RsiW